MWSDLLPFALGWATGVLSLMQIQVTQERRDAKRRHPSAWTPLFDQESDQPTEGTSTT